MVWNCFPGAGAPDRTRLIRQILLRAHMDYDLKSEIMGAVRKHTDPANLMAELNTMSLPASLTGAILEILTAF